MAKSQEHEAALRMPVAAVEATPETPTPTRTPAPTADAGSPDTTSSALPDGPDANDEDPQQGQQSKRILFIIPNFRSVSVDAKLPSLTSKEKFKLAVADSFDYSSFIYVGMVAGVQQLNNSTPEFRQGASGYGRYYWHAFADNTDGNLMTEALYPSIFHQDPRYYTLGRGGFGKRLVYSVGRLFITRSDDGSHEFNISEVAGNATSAAIGNLYYPARERTASKTISNWGLQIGLDGASNVLKEFWPDISYALTHKRADPVGAPASHP